MATTTELIISAFLVKIPTIIITSTAKSGAAFFWMAVKMAWSSYWLYIIIFITAWVIWELVTRNGGFHYNSKNGFSPTFNRVVGSGVFLLFQGGVYLIISRIFGNEVYDNIWPYPIHLTVFIFTGLFLNLTGFWVYWKLPRF